MRGRRIDYQLFPYHLATERCNSLARWLQSSLVLAWSFGKETGRVDFEFQFVSNLSASVGSTGSAIAIVLTCPQSQLILQCFSIFVSSGIWKKWKSAVWRIFSILVPRSFSSCRLGKDVLSVDFSTDKKNGESNSNSNSTFKFNLRRI